VIAHIRGELAALSSDSVVVDVGGVGYRCLVSGSTRSRLPALGQAVQLFTSLQVREDSMTLYGFLTGEEFELFELLLRVEGVGPKVALGVLSASTPDGFRRAVAFEDIPALTRIPGIGKKTAQKIVIELKDKIGDLGAAPTFTGIAVPGGAVPAAPDAFSEAMEALMALGYSRAEAAQALDRARREAGEQPRTETLVRIGLKQLFRG